MNTHPNKPCPTPLHLKLLIHACTSSSPIPNRGAEMVETYLYSLVLAGLIRREPLSPAGFVGTEAGQKFLDRLLATRTDDPHPDTRVIPLSVFSPRELDALSVQLTTHLQDIRIRRVSDQLTANREGRPLDAKLHAALDRHEAKVERTLATIAAQRGEIVHDMAKRRSDRELEHRKRLIAHYDQRIAELKSKSKSKSF